MRTIPWLPTRSKIKKPENILKASLIIHSILCLGSMATMSIGAGVVFLGLIYYRINKKIPFNIILKEKKPKIYFFYSCLLALAIFTSLLGAHFFPLTYSGVVVQVDFLKDLNKIWYFFWPLLLAYGMKSMDDSGRKTILRTWLMTFGLLGLIGLVQYYTGWPRNQPIPNIENRFHASLFFGHHLSAASILIFPFFAALQYSLTTKDKIESGKYLFIAILGCITLFLSFSRTLWFTFPLGIFILCARLVSKKVSFSIALLMFCLGILFLQKPSIQNRILDVFGKGAYKNQYALNTRVDLWKANLAFFKERPLTGAGFKKNHELSGPYLQEKQGVSHVFAGHAHNNFLDFLGGTGLFGALSCLAWCVCVFWLLTQKSKIDLVNQIRFGLFCAWLVFHFNGITQLNFLDAKVQHQIAWVIAWSLL